MEGLNPSDAELGDILVRPSNASVVRRAPPSSKAARLDDWYAGVTFSHPSDDENADDEDEDNLKHYRSGDIPNSNSSLAHHSDYDSDDSETGGVLVFSTPGQSRR